MTLRPPPPSPMEHGVGWRGVGRGQAGEGYRYIPLGGACTRVDILKSGQPTGPTVSLSPPRRARLSHPHARHPHATSATWPSSALSPDYSSSGRIGSFCSFACCKLFFFGWCSVTQHLPFSNPPSQTDTHPHSGFPFCGFDAIPDGCRTLQR